MFTNLLYRLNEGFTTYLERRIAAKISGEKERHLLALGDVVPLSKLIATCLLHGCALLLSLLYYTNLPVGWEALADAVSVSLSCSDT